MYIAQTVIHQHYQHHITNKTHTQISIGVVYLSSGIFTLYTRLVVLYSTSLQVYEFSTNTRTHPETKTTHNYDTDGGLNRVQSCDDLLVMRMTLGGFDVRFRHVQVVFLESCCSIPFRLSRKPALCLIL